MGTDLYAITVTKTEPLVVTLDLQEVYAGAGLWADKSFALMLLQETAKPGDPLAQAVGFEDTQDSVWMSKYAGGFVANVELKDRQKKKKSRATLEITVTDSAWIAHLAPAQAWKSSAFMVTESYETCAPITLASRDNVGETGANGFVVAAMSIWGIGDVDDLPATVLVPAYGNGAYHVTEELAGPFDRQRLAQFAFRAVRLVSRGAASDGVLVLSDHGCYLCEITHNSRGRCGFEYDSIERIGLLELKPKPRLGRKLSHARMVECAGFEVVALRCNGAVVELEIAARRDGSMPQIESASDVLRIVAAPLVDFTGGVTGGDAPLARALLEDCEPDSVSGDDMFVQFANAYVKSYELAVPDPAELPELDTMELAAVQAWLESTPPLGRLTVTMTDASWLDHLVNAKPRYPVEEYALATALERPARRPA